MRGLRIILLAAVIVVGLSYAYVGTARVIAQDQMIDFASYYTAATLAIEDRDIYDNAAREAKRVELGLSELPPYIYPPLLAAVLKPLALLPYHSARIIWTSASVLALLASLALLARTLALSQASCIILLLATLFLPGTWITLWLGQVNMFLLLLLALALHLGRLDKHPAAGFALGLAAMVKLFPAILIAYFALKRRFLAVFWSALVSGILSVVTIMLTGLDNQVRFFTGGLGTAVKLAEGLPYDQSTNAFLARFFVRTGYTAPLIENSQLTNLLTVVATALIAAAVVAAIVRNGPTISSVGYSLVVATMLLVSTKTWDHYGVFLLVPLAVALKQPGLAASKPTRLQLALLFAFLLLVVQGFWTVLPQSIWLASFGFYGTLIIWACFLRINWTSTVQPRLSTAGPSEHR